MADETNMDDNLIEDSQTEQTAESEETVREKVEAYNQSVKEAQYNSYRFAQNQTAPESGNVSNRVPVSKAGHKANKAPAGRKRKLGAALAIIGGLAFAAVIGLVLFNGAKMLKANIAPAADTEASRLPDKNEGPSFGRRAGVSDLPEDADLPNSESGINEAQRERASSADGEMTIVDIAEKCKPSMVIITTTTVQEMQSLFGGTQQQEGEAAGTGIIIEKTEDAIMIVTNNHVIAGSQNVGSEPSHVSIGFDDGEVVSAEIVGRDVAEDLAVLSVKLADMKDSTLKAIRVIETGDSEECRVGESVVAIGNALGCGQTVSAGIISALNREVVVEGVNHTLIQTDAAINPGNSGGALLNMKGQLIGINEVKYAETTVEGMGYAIPMSTAGPIIDRLMNRETREKVAEEKRSYIGVVCVTIPASYVAQGYPSGVYISEVTAGQAAEKAGIKVGDIISAIDGYSVTTAEELISELEYYSAGTTVELTVLRQDEENSKSGFRSTKIEVTLGSRAEAHLDDQKDSKAEKSEPETEAPEDSNDAGNSQNGGGSENQFPFNWEDFFELPFSR